MAYTKSNQYTTPTTYTPSWTSSGTAPSLGNGTLTGRYIQIGNLVIVTINGTMGSTTTYGTGTYSWSLPVNAAGTGFILVGSAYTNAGGAAFSTGAAVIASGGSTLSVITDGDGNTWGQLLPATWASGNLFNITIAYFAA